MFEIMDFVKKLYNRGPYIWPSPPMCRVGGTDKSFCTICFEFPNSRDSVRWQAYVANVESVLLLMNRVVESYDVLVELYEEMCKYSKHWEY